MRELREIALVASCLLIAVGAGSAISVGCGGSDTASGGNGGSGTFSSLPSTGGNTNAGGTNAGGTSVFTTSTGGAGPGGTGGSNTSNAGGSNTGGSGGTGGAGGTGGTNAGGGGATASSAASTAASSASSSAASSTASSSAASSTASSSASSSTAASSSAASSSSTGGGNTLTVWINEIHYDNTGGDTAEGVEIAGVAGTDLTGYSVVLYDGATGHTYDNALTFTGSIPNQSNGFGAVNATHGAIQNGPDGLALIGPGNTVIQFLSYEGTFAATNGPAMGLTSVDIGVAENGSGPVGQSLQLTGAGHTYSDFTWAADASATPGAINGGQTFP